MKLIFKSWKNYSKFKRIGSDILKKSITKSIFIIILIIFGWRSISDGNIGIFLVIFNHFLEDSFELIVDLVEIFSFGEMDDKSGLQLDMAVLTVIFLDLHSFGLEPWYSNIFVLEQALGNKTDGEIGLIINAVKFNCVELVFEEVLHLNDNSLKSLILSD